MHICDFSTVVIVPGLGVRYLCRVYIALTQCKLLVCAEVTGEKEHAVVNLDAVHIIEGEPGDAMDVST